jgi:hypothetical protein
MKHPNIEHIIADDISQRTYVVLSPRALTDGEIYSRIRKAILRRGGQPLARGETLTIDPAESISVHANLPLQVDPSGAVTA